MTDETNQCNCHKKIEKSITTLEKAVEDIWDTIFPRWAVILFSLIILSFGMTMLHSVDLKASQNSEDIKCLQSMAGDIRDIKDVVVKK